MGLEEITKDTVKGAALRELQGLKVQPAVGNTANTNIALAGATLKKTTVVFVLEYDPSGSGAGLGTFADRTSEAAIISDGFVQLDTTDTTGSILLVGTLNKA